MPLERSSRPVIPCLTCLRRCSRHATSRTFLTTTSLHQDLTITPSEQTSPPPPSAKGPKGPLDPNLVHTRRSERELYFTHNQHPIGSRRRRAAMQSSSNIPFHQLPYQCFQEARKYLQEDREVKVEEITRYRERIQRLGASEVPPENEAQKEHRLRSMRRRLEETKILADINDPLVKKRFEDGKGMFINTHIHLSYSTLRNAS